MEFVNFKVRASLPERLFQLPPTSPAQRPRSTRAIKGRRPAYSVLKQEIRIPTRSTTVTSSSPARGFTGPAIIEEKESTIVVGEDATVAVDEYGFVWIDIK
ncbi:MAG: hypothetical protein MZW92_70960 [Comamonadaceae bacterium]|nr:hypothetical protein [Comamonadaceae bacterium]